MNRNPDPAALSALAVRTYTAAFGHSFTPEDLAAILRTQLSPEAFRAALERDTFLTVHEAHSPIAFLQFGPAKDAADGTVELRRLYVAPERQGEGIGSRLLTEALAHRTVAAAPRVILDVWEHNVGARRLYERFGFREYARRRLPLPNGGEGDADILLERLAGE